MILYATDEGVSRSYVTPEGYYHLAPTVIPVVRRSRPWVGAVVVVAGIAALLGAGTFLVYKLSAALVGFGFYLYDSLPL